MYFRFILSTFQERCFGNIHLERWTRRVQAFLFLRHKRKHRDLVHHIESSLAIMFFHWLHKFVHSLDDGMSWAFRHIFHCISFDEYLYQNNPLNTRNHRNHLEHELIGFVIKILEKVRLPPHTTILSSKMKWSFLLIQDYQNLFLYFSRCQLNVYLVMLTALGSQNTYNWFK